MKHKYESALYVGGIAALSTLTAIRSISIEGLYAAFIGFWIAFLIECQKEMNEQQASKKMLKCKRGQTFFF